MQMIYLDNNATTRPADEVVRAMERALRDLWANPSSVHRAGQQVRHEVELARHATARLIGCKDRELILTSGGTEAANLAIMGSLEAHPERSALVTSALEHSAVRELAERLEKQGRDVIWLPNDEHGVVEVPALCELLEARAAQIGLVSIMWVNNETGVIQPIEEMGEMCRAHGVRFHTDATQWVGKMPVDVGALPIDLLSFAAHKFHGPKGVGGLYVRRSIRVEPQVIGGPHERELRGGTENVPGIIGMGVAAALAQQWLAASQHTEKQSLRDRLEREVQSRIAECSVNSSAAPRVWNTSNIAFPRLEAEAILLLLSERGVCASAGAACSSGSLDPSPVLLAMHIPRELAHGSIRFTLSRETTDQEIERAIEIIPEVIARLRAGTASVTH